MNFGNPMDLIRLTTLLMQIEEHLQTTTTVSYKLSKKFRPQFADFNFQELEKPFNKLKRGKRK